MLLYHGTQAPAVCRKEVRTMAVRLSVLLTVLLICLTACGGTGGITTQQVFDQLQRAGLAANARAVAPSETDSPIGRCGERLEFDVPGGGSGTIIVCSPPVVIDAFGGAVLYRSTGGSVNVLVSGAPAIAPRIGEQVQQIRE